MASAEQHTAAEAESIAATLKTALSTAASSPSSSSQTGLHHEAGWVRSAELAGHSHHLSAKAWEVLQRSHEDNVAQDSEGDFPEPGLVPPQTFDVLLRARSRVDAAISALLPTSSAEVEEEAASGAATLKALSHTLPRCRNVEEYKECVCLAAGSTPHGPADIEVPHSDVATVPGSRKTGHSSIGPVYWPQERPATDSVGLRQCSLGWLPGETPRALLVLPDGKEVEDCEALQTSVPEPQLVSLDVFLEQFIAAAVIDDSRHRRVLVNGAEVRDTGEGLLRSTVASLAGALQAEDPALATSTAFVLACSIAMQGLSMSHAHMLCQDSVATLGCPTLVSITPKASRRISTFHVASGRHAGGWGTYVRSALMQPLRVEPLDEGGEPIASIEATYIVTTAISQDLRPEALRSIQEAGLNPSGSLAPVTVARMATTVDAASHLHVAFLNVPEEGAQQEALEQALVRDAETEQPTQGLEDFLRAMERRKASEGQALPMHTTAFSWGRGDYGALGHAGFSPREYPEAVPFPATLGFVRIQCISCSWFHSAAVSDMGMLYTWGSGSDGALGHGNTSSVTSPLPVDFFGAEHPLSAVAVACGSDVGGTHTLVIARGRLSEDQAAAASGPRVFAFGFGPALGIGSTADSLRPTEVVHPDWKGDSPHLLTAGGSFSVAVTRSGATYSWGKWASGRLGHGPIPQRRRSGEPAYLLRPQQVDLLRGTRLLDVAAGEAHVVAVDSHGFLWTWGAGGAGQLGDGQGADSMVPTRLTVEECLDQSDAMDQSPVDSHTPHLAEQVDASITGAGSDMETARSEDGDEAQQSRAQHALRFVHVAAGRSHSLAISASGGLYSWGGGGGSMLGHGDALQRVSAAEDQALAEGAVVSLWSARLPGTVWNRPWLRPRRVQALCGTEDSSGCSIVAADGGAEHSVAITASGEVFSWGSGPACGLGSATPVLVPSLVSGAASAALLSYNEHGELTAAASPHDASRSFGQELAYLIATSGWHTLAVSVGSNMGCDLQLATPPGVSSQLVGFHQRTLAAMAASAEPSELGEDDIDGASTVSKVASFLTTDRAVRGHDVLLRVEDSQLPAHKALLACRSRRFAELLEEEEIADHVTELTLPDVSWQVLLLMLEFIYTDNICVPLTPLTPHLPELALAAEAYHIPGLLESCRALQASSVAKQHREGDGFAAGAAWSVGTRSLAPDLASSLLTPTWADSVFVADGERLLAHRAIVCSRSQFFSVLFQEISATAAGEAKSTTLVEVEVPDSKWGFQRLLAFLYTSELPPVTDSFLAACGMESETEVLLQDLLLADRYSLQRMKSACESCIGLTYRNACKVLEIADLVSAPRLRERALSFITSHVAQVAASPAFVHLQREAPQLLVEVQARIRQRNTTYVAPPAPLKTALQAAAEKEQEEQDELFSVQPLPWWVLLAVVCLGVLYSYVAVFNTSFGFVVPALNVVVLLGAVAAALRSMGE